MTPEDDAHSPRGFDSFEVRLGDELRGERATLGKSLLDVQRDLRIKAAYIAAIENADPHVFPNQGFIAGYIRSYARYLNLDPDEIYRRFCAESGFTGINASLQRSQSPRAARKPVGAVSTSEPFGPFVVRQAAIQNRSSFDVSPSAIGSVMVLACLVVGLVYGGYTVLQNIQRVRITPVNQTPAAIAEIGTLPGPGLGAQEVELDLAADSAGTIETTRDRDLSRLYQPRELELPVVARRDGPIVDIDPDEGRTTLASDSEDDLRVVGALIAEEYGPPPLAEPQVREAVSVPRLMVGVQLPAWVRVYLADGTVLFEKTLDKGELFEVPIDGQAPLLRAGMSGYVYMVVDGVAYGPVGSGTSVVKSISLLPEDIKANLPPLEELPEALVASVAALTELEQ